jgi:hypothetical protein
MARSQRHMREIQGYDASGQTAFMSGLAPIRPLLWVDDAAGQSVNFKTLYFPDGSNFALSTVPTGMSLNASTGLLDGTPTTVQSSRATLTVTYLSPSHGSAIAKVPVLFEIGAAAGSIAAGAYTNGVAITPLNFATSFPGASSFALSTIPAGLTLSAAGTLSGTPSAISSNSSTLSLMYAGFGDVRTYSWSWAVTA